MNLPSYLTATEAPRDPGNRGHRGLWWERFFSGYDQNWQPDQGAATAWLRSVARGTCGDPGELRRVAARHQAIARARGGVTAAFDTQGLLLTGMGLPHPLENGLLWHPTLGVPYLPGQQLKGLLRSWLEVWAEDENHLSKHLGTPERMGRYAFLDAVPLEPVALAVDVMTPHRGKWYLNGGGIQAVEGEPDPAVVPADWHDPVPIRFLAVRQACFLVTLLPTRVGNAQDELKTVLDALGEAFEWLRAGAKTAVGYGRLRGRGGEPPQHRSSYEDEAPLLRVSPGAGRPPPPMEHGATEGQPKTESPSSDAQLEALIGAARKEDKLGDVLAEAKQWIESGEAAPDQIRQLAQVLREQIERMGRWAPDARSKWGERSRCVAAWLARQEDPPATDDQA